MNYHVVLFHLHFFASAGGGVVAILQLLALLQYLLMPYFRWPSPFIILHMFSSWYCVVAKRKTKWDMCNTFILLQIIISLKAMWNEIPLFCYNFFSIRKLSQYRNILCKCIFHVLHCVFSFHEMCTRVWLWFIIHIFYNSKRWNFMIHVLVLCKVITIGKGYLNLKVLGPSPNDEVFPICLPPYVATLKGTHPSSFKNININIETLSLKIFYWQKLY